MNLSRTLFLLTLVACDGDEGPKPKTMEELAAEKCPRVHIDKMAGNWVLETGDPKTRFQIVERGGETILWITDVSFSNHRIELTGKKREKDWQFDERAKGERKRLIETSGEAPKRMYVQPRMKSCRLEVYAGSVVSGKEQMPTSPKRFAEFPDTGGVVFSFAAFDDTLFLAAAAADKAVADKQIEDLGYAQPDTAMGTVTVGAWSAAEADGAADCTFTATAFFDGKRVKGAEAIAVAPPVEGLRHWTHTFEAPYSGNHRFELHRMRTCGGKSERIAVAGIDAILQ